MEVLTAIISGAACFAVGVYTERRNNKRRQKQKALALAAKVKDELPRLQGGGY